MDYPSNLSAILTRARTATKGNWFVYEAYKKRIRKASDTIHEYTTAIKELTNILEL